MASGQYFAGVVGAVLGVAGFVLLMLAWARKRQARGYLIGGGWALLAISMWPWAVFGGVDRGPAIAFVFLSLVAIAIILRNGAISGRGRVAASDDGDAGTTAGGSERIPWLRRTWVFLLIGPVAGLSAIALGLAAFVFGPGAEGDRISLAAYLMPLAWGALSAWAACDPKLLRKTVGVVGAGAASGAAVVLLNLM